MLIKGQFDHDLAELLKYPGCLCLPLTLAMHADITGYCLERQAKQRSHVPSEAYI